MSETPELKKLISSLNNLCAEANAATRLSAKIFATEDLKFVRRNLAKCMEIVDGEIGPLLTKHYPDAKLFE